MTNTRSLSLSLPRFGSFIEYQTLIRSNCYRTCVLVGKSLTFIDCLNFRATGHSFSRRSTPSQHNETHDFANVDSFKSRLFSLTRWSQTIGLPDRSFCIQHKTRKSRVSSLRMRQVDTTEECPVDTGLIVKLVRTF